MHLHQFKALDGYRVCPVTRKTGDGAFCPFRVHSPLLLVADVRCVDGKYSLMLQGGGSWMDMLKAVDDHVVSKLGGCVDPEIAALRYLSPRRKKTIVKMYLCPEDNFDEVVVFDSEFNRVELSTPEELRGAHVAVVADLSHAWTVPGEDADASAPRWFGVMWKVVQLMVSSPHVDQTFVEKILQQEQSP